MLFWCRWLVRRDVARPGVGSSYRWHLYSITLTDLARRLDIPLTTLHREADRLTNAELLRSRAVGRSRLLRANPDHRATEPLTQLLQVTFGPHTVIEDEFATLPAVSRVLIYGSWAARYHGAPGGPPADIDVLVIGTPAREDVYEAADRAESRLGIEVNPVMRTLPQWENATDALVQQIQSDPSVTVLETTRDDAA